MLILKEIRDRMRVDFYFRVRVVKVDVVKRVVDFVRYKINFVRRI